MSPSESSAGSSESAASGIAPLDPAARAGAHVREGAAASAPASNGAARALASDPTSVASLTPSEASAGAVCASCGAPLAPDQRYCLACGQPASPVRLAFLDVLQGEYQPGAAGSYGSGVPGAPPTVAYYAPPPEPDGLLGALRRYSGLLALTGVLLAALLIGLLVGHWITGGNGATTAAGKQVIEVKGLSGALVAPTGTNGAGSAASSSNHGSTDSGSQSHHSAKQEAKQEAKEAKEVAAVKAPPPVQKKTNPTSLQKLDKTTGKQHVKEVNEQFKGNEPIETGH